MFRRLVFWRIRRRARARRASVRARAARKLGVERDRESLAVLRSLLIDSEYEVRAEAIRSLRSYPDWAVSEAAKSIIPKPRAGSLVSIPKIRNFGP